MKANIIKKNKIAKLTLEVTYDLMGKVVDFKPGQFFFVTLLDAPNKDSGKDPVHHFTIVNSPVQKGILVNATRLRDTAFKNSLRDMPVGSEVEIDRLMGSFSLPTDTTKQYCFIALGIGITPYVSMLRYIHEKHLDYKIILLYSDSDRESMAYLDELEGYAKEDPGLKLILTITHDENWHGETRHIDDKFIKDYLKNPENYVYYISGPPLAVQTVAQEVGRLGVGKDSIKTEKFSGY